LAHPYAVGRKRIESSRQTAAGDVVITKVSGHYHISRAQGSGKPFAPLDVIDRRADAIARACQLATGHQRVFMYGKGGSPDCVEVNCAKPKTDG
jgi:hypothetical protein